MELKYRLDQAIATHSARDQEFELMQQELNALRDETHSFSGHANLKQRIHLHQNIKQENEKLQLVILAFVVWVDSPC